MIDLTKREEAKDAARAAAWDEGQECPTCHEGRIPGGRKLIHSFRGCIGADWDLDSVLAAIDSATAVRWVDHSLNHNLQVTESAGSVVYFAVTKPEAAA